MAQIEQRVLAAKNAIRKKYTTLTTAVTQGTIPGALYEQGIIDDETLEIANKRALTDQEKGSKIMNEVRKAVQSNPDLLGVFCEALERESILKELSDELKENYKRNLDELTEKKTHTVTDYVAGTLQTDAISTSSEKGELMKLKDELETYQTALARPNASEAAIVCIKECIEHYIETTLKAGSVKPEELQEEMHSLCHRDLLVPSSIRAWVLEQVEETNKKLLSTIAVPDSPSQSDPVAEPKLFCKDTLYHASMCCQVSSSCTPQNFKTFLNRQSPGHTLEEVSMSMPQDEEENVGGFLIAKRKNTIYIAFQGNPTLSWWLKNPASFDDGLKKQMHRVPWLFFAEQLQDHNRIVITGFSFGGMLACCVAANIWEKSYISTEVLEKDVVCITFGQPLIAIPFLQSVMKKFPKFETTVHSVLDSEDVVPRLFHYFSVGCIHYRSVSVKRSSPQFYPKAMHTAAETKFPRKRPSSAPHRSRSGMGFRESFASFLQNIAVLQEAQEHVYSGILVSSEHSKEALKTKALNEVKSVLRELAPIANASASVVCGTCYTISCEEGAGLAWKAKLPAEKLGLGADMIEKLETTLFEQHNMDGYRHNVFRSYLEKQPDKYSGPDQTQATKEIKEVSLLTPEVKTVEFHEYPNEYAVVLEGDNLWFCHQIQIGNKSKIATAVQNITRRSIQFNFTSSDSEKLTMPENGHIEITLYSRFAQPIRDRATVKQEPYPFSRRQIQLAKHTPSEIIQLAFWSTILEWRPKRARHYKPSPRFKEVTRFIEEAAKVVPLESIFYAVAYCDDDIALECSKAILAYFSNRRNVPPSDMMVEGSKTAAERMRTGVCMPDEKAGIAMRSSTMVTSDVEDYFQSVHNSMSTASEPSSKPAIPRSTSAPSAIQGSYPADENAMPLHPHPDIAECLLEVAQNIKTTAEAAKKRGKLDVVCNLNIEQVYPSRGQTLYRIDRTLKSPVKVLTSARKTLESFVQEVQSKEAQSIEANNEELVELLKDIQENELQICAALLGAFMEQQIRIPLLAESPEDMAKVFSAPVAVGVWALFSLSYADLQKMLSQTQGNTLFVEIADYISGIFHPEEHDRLYAGKLQFLLQGIKKTVSCSSQYISYSLEHQLCNNPRFDKSIPLKRLIDSWEKIFEGDALSLVAKSHRPLIARWLKWAVLVHDLREALAKYTCVGVIGLVNSGKSQLVNTLFKVQTLVGTTEQKRTVVPLMYNLDGSVDGLDVIDFPGVDDRDHSIPGLAKLLITLSQVVIFVVDYRKIHTDPAKQWLSELEAEDVPLQVCLTHADRLYAELMGTEGNNPDPTESKKQKIHEELDQIKQSIGYHQSRSVTFYCFHQEPDSSITTESLREVNIFGPLDVGEWLVSTFKQKLGQKELADNLEKFIRSIRGQYRARSLSQNKGRVFL